MLHLFVTIQPLQHRESSTKHKEIPKSLAPAGCPRCKQSSARLRPLLGLQHVHSSSSVQNLKGRDSTCVSEGGSRTTLSLLLGYNVSDILCCSVLIPCIVRPARGESERRTSFCKVIERSCLAQRTRRLHAKVDEVHASTFTDYSALW